jgi:hypothetical protein
MGLVKHMMHAITRAMFSDPRRLFAFELRARCSRRFSVLFIVLAVLLVATSVLHGVVPPSAMWNANPESDIAGYILSYGTSPGVHPTSVDVGKVITWPVAGLTPGTRYCFVLQAYNTSA